METRSIRVKAKAKKGGATRREAVLFCPPFLSLLLRAVHAEGRPVVGLIAPSVKAMDEKVERIVREWDVVFPLRR